MNEIIPAIYEQGVLRPLAPVPVQERTRVHIQIVAQFPDVEDERQRVYQALQEAGIIHSQPSLEPIQPVSEAELATAANALAAAGPLSELIIADRDGR